MIHRNVILNLKSREALTGLKPLIVLADIAGSFNVSYMLAFPVNCFVLHTVCASQTDHKTNVSTMITSLSNHAVPL